MQLFLARPELRCNWSIEEDMMQTRKCGDEAVMRMLVVPEYRIAIYLQRRQEESIETDDPSCGLIHNR